MNSITALVRRAGVATAMGLIVAMVAAQEPPKPPPPPAQPPTETPPRVQRERVRRERIPSESASVRLEVTLFKVDVAKEKVVELDAKKLAANKPSAAGLLTTLQDFGPAEALYRIDQVVDGERRAAISISRSTPYVVATGRTNGGQTSRSMARDQSGTKIEFRGSFSDESKQRLDALLEIELKTTNNSAPDEDSGAAFPVSRSVTQDFGGELELGKPIVLISVDAAATGTDKPVAYISLVMVSAP
jgi:hypothetical protein